MTEVLGLVALLVGGVLVVVGVGLLAGLPWAACVAGVLLAAAGGVLVRLAAAMPPKGGDAS